MTARSSAVRSTLARARVGRDPRAPVTRQVDADDAPVPGERGRMAPPARPAAGEAVDEQQRAAGATAPDLPAKAVDDDAAHSRARASVTAAAASRWSSTLRARSVRNASTRTPGRPIDAASAARIDAGDDLAVLAAERGHDRPDVDAVGRAEELLVVLGQADLGRVGVGLRQEREDPAAVVVDQDDRRRQAVQPGGHQGVQVVQERHVADDEDDRPDLGRGRPERGRHDAVDAVRAAVGQRPDRSLAARQPVVQVAHRHAVPGPQQRPVGQGRAESGERQALERLVAGLHRCKPRRQRRVGGAIGVEPGCRPRARRGVAVGAGSLDGIGQRAGRGHAVGVDERGRQDGRIAPAAVTVDDDLDRLRVGQHRQHRLGRRGRPEPDHELGQMRVAPGPGRTR